jgi:hypothetical protein
VLLSGEQISGGLRWKVHAYKHDRTQLTATQLLKNFAVFKPKFHHHVFKSSSLASNYESGYLHPKSSFRVYFNINLAGSNLILYFMGLF